MRALRLWVLGVMLVAVSLASGSARADDDTLWRGVSAFRSGNYRGAVDAFLEHRRQNPTADLAAYLGPAYYKLGELDAARRELARGVRRGNDDPVTVYYLGLTYYRLGFSSLARRAFEAVRDRQRGGKLAEGAERFLTGLDHHTDPLPAATILTFATTLCDAAPDLAFDYASEAFLRAQGADDRARARALMAQLVGSSLSDVRPYAERIAGGALHVNSTPTAAAP